MKKFIITLLGIVFTIVAYSQSDFDIAQSFMSKKGVTLVDDKTSTRGNTEPYSVFNGEDGKGFAIVVNGAIVGYSVDDSIGEFPEPLKGMLEVYKTFTRSDEKDYPEEFTPRNVAPIEPLIKTKWGQGGVYKSMCPKDGDENCLTGCTATALAQVLYYYRLPYGCKAFDGKYNVDFFYHETINELPATTFDWDNMLLEYKDGNYTQENVDAVAKLMLYCGALCHSSYGIDATYGVINPGVSTRGEDIFTYYLYYDGCEYCNTESHSDDDMTKVIDNTLEAKKPIINIAFSDGGGHSYIIDGRDSDGLFHINWGWAGGADGYFIIASELFEKYGARHNIANYSHHNNLIIPNATLEYTTAIERVSCDADNDDNIYNLQGQKVGDSLEGLPKGVYIMNGKKSVAR